MTIAIGAPVQVLVAGNKWAPGFILDLEDPFNPGDGLLLAIMTYNPFPGDQQVRWGAGRGFRRDEIGTSWRFFTFHASTTVDVVSTATAVTTVTSET